jgi:predicted RecA/RadA family phage recombinase
MKNQVQIGDEINVVAPVGGVVSGNGYLIGTSIFGVAAVTVAAGVSTALWVRGIYTLTKTSAQAWAVGDPIYWDNTNFRCDNVSSVGFRIGVCTKAAANPSAVGEVRLDGDIDTSLANTNEVSATGITAGTTRTQGGATALAKGLNRIDTSTAPAVGTLLGDGVALPVAAPGASVTIVNNTLNPVQVYGNGADTVNGVAGATGVAIPGPCFEIFKAAAAGGWNYDAGVGYSGQLSTLLTAAGCTALSGGQAGALLLPADLNRITTVAAGNGVKLPPAVPGLDIYVLNHGANALQVYGSGTDTIDDIATATGVTQMVNSVAIFTCYEVGKWYSANLGAGFSPTGLPTVAFQDAIAAAGSSQATATQLTAMVNTIATVAPGTGVNLPQSAPGMQITIQNNGANPVLVYPLQGSADTINGIMAANGVQQHAGSIATYNCTIAGAWKVAASSPVNSAYSTAANTVGFTATGVQISGGLADSYLDLTGALGAGAALTLPTVAQLVQAMHSPTIGQSYMLRIINRSSGNFAWTVTTNTGWTLNGLMTVAQNTWREFIVTLTSLTTATLQTVGIGTAP